jgi:hypothetical protein
MAFYIKIQKVAEDDSLVRYSFEGEQGKQGLFDLDKSTNEVTLIEAMPSDEKKHYFNRASVKVMREWREGHLPEMTEWAS